MACVGNHEFKYKISDLWTSQPRDQTQVSLIAGEFFTSWPTREALNVDKSAIYSAASEGAVQKNGPQKGPFNAWNPNAWNLWVCHPTWQGCD